MACPPISELMKPNILHIALTDKWGGGANQIQNLCKELSQTDQTNNHLLSIAGGEIDERISREHLTFHGVKMKFKADPRAVLKILRICRTQKIDLIHLHGSTALTLGVIASKLGQLPSFVFSKKTSFPIKNRKLTLYKYNHRKLKKIFCVSEKTREICRRSIEDQTKLVTIYHGTDLENKSSETPFLLRERLKLDDSTLIVGTIANHIRAKNLETWVEVINEIINKRGLRNFHFVQIGSPSEITKKLDEKINENGLEEFISIMGFIPDASNFIPQFDISLLTSQSEGLPQFIYESFYHRVPVVSTNVGGIPEIISDSENGMLSNPYEVKTLADKLIALSQDKELQQKFTENSFRILEKKFTTRIMAQETLAEYKKLLYG